MESEGRVLRPRPRRGFELTPSTTDTSGPPTPSTEDSPNLNPDTANSNNAGGKDGLTSASRNQSILNLTSPALLGIYSPTAIDGSREDLLAPNTPWGTGAQTPSLRMNGTIPEEGEYDIAPAAAAAVLRTRSQRHHVPRKHGFKGFVWPLIKRSALLFIFGVAYGVIITHLHDDPRVPVTLGNIIDLGSWQYMALWGIAGLGLGSLLPWVDGLWEDMSLSEKQQRGPVPTSTESPSSLAAVWYPMVRGIGAFVGIAFAIRKLPWQSTLQVSLTLSLANPVLWYLVDRSKSGFMLSTVVGLTGMLALLNINPDIVPSPAATAPSPIAGEDAPAQANVWYTRIPQESIIVGTWIASMLFCTCVCFGNIGRRLAS